MDDTPLADTKESDWQCKETNTNGMDGTPLADTEESILHIHTYNIHIQQVYMHKQHTYTNRYIFLGAPCRDSWRETLTHSVHTRIRTSC
jgi:hypothetical protein